MFRIAAGSAPQDVEYFFEFYAQLPHNLLAHAAVGLDLIAGQALAGAADRKTVLI